MKIKFLFLIGLFYSSLNAQSHYAGQYSLGLNYGIVENGNNYNINLQKIIGNKYWGARLDVDYLTKDYTLDFKNVGGYNGTFDSKKVGLAVNYSLEKIIPHPFYLQLYLGGVYSNEKLNDFKLEYLSMPNYNKNNFGVYMGTELEFVIFPTVSLTAGVKYQNIIQSDLEKENIIYQGGIKFNL